MGKVGVKGSRHLVFRWKNPFFDCRETLADSFERMDDPLGVSRRAPGEDDNFRRVSRFFPSPIFRARMGALSL